MQSVATFAALLAVAVLLVPLFKRAGLGTVLGYLAAGVLIGPSGFGVVTDGENLLHTAELGVVLLLFIIGLELQPSRLWALRKPVFGLGGLQFFGVGSFLIAGAWLLGFDWPIAIMIGLTLALSSTAFVLPTLGERHELHSRYGRETFAILLFQDLMVIPLLALLPLLGAARSEGDVSPLVGLGFLAVVVLIGRPVLDAIFRHVTRINSREMFTAAALATALGLALLLQLGGLSMSLGAFVAGVLLSDSDFRHELEASIAPFQGLLMGFFFIAVGMTINLGMIVEHPINVLGLTIALILVKGGGMYGLRRLARGSKQVSRMQALALAQCGEFAFVLFGVAQANQLLAPEVVAQLNLSVALSMATAPLLFILADRLNAREAAATATTEPEAEEMPDLPNPVVMAGFGRVGQIVGRVLLARNVPFTALDIDHEEVKTMKRFGIQAYYGNAAHLEVLHAARIEDAKVFVLAIDDIETSLRCAEMVRKHFPQVTIVARARNRFHAYRLMDLGVELLMRETFRSSLDMTRMIFEVLGKTPEKSQQIVDRFAEHDGELLKREQALYHDEHQLIQSAREATEELSLILEQELGDALPESPSPDDAASDTATAPRPAS
ncbi:monovalent cation:proton antiporter-2 (CPA2) family protein [Denitromonas ohlonensis]|uniref:Glutathione-regulated potassium-efflux system protein KefB n=2 Tax=Denitromonas TaxID=139331 RepID=A0A558EP62_9RHOO|nr:monovalent cation:proton antiporter-2 (CPA2) family protein [Denitromonas ohlonensis]TVO62664.1 glutathione-regulated potassium-efflux system protein KefB [Denitromonas ohlonensis]TVO78868.1 glutathione-regulated potassium-efflux system protein KefB [Denitromonas ohlonensis]TVT75156.1 MAG: glutathione-regulated potassium-efflux system protein KefB [Denitromonas halophila]